MYFISMQLTGWLCLKLFRRKTNFNWWDVISLQPFYIISLFLFFYYFWISFTIYVPSFCRYLPFCFSFPFEYFVINPKLKLNKTHVFSRVHKHYKAAKSAFSIHSMKKKNARNNKNLKQSKNFSKFYMPGSHTHTLDDHKIE